jgi:hypothetical protein
LDTSLENEVSTLLLLLLLPYVTHLSNHESIIFSRENRKRMTYFVSFMSQQTRSAAHLNAHPEHMRNLYQVCLEASRGAAIPRRL